MNARERMCAVEQRILEKAIPAIERALRVVLVRVSGKEFQIENGDARTVDPVSGATCTLEIKNRTTWFGDFLFEDWSDRNKSRGWAWYCKAKLLAQYWEDAECVCVLDAPRALAWYRSQRSKGLYAAEIVPHISQRNETVNHAVPFYDLCANRLILFDDMPRSAYSSRPAAQPPAQPRLFG